MVQAVPIDVVLDAIKLGRPGVLREALPDEKPDWVQERDKLCTGITCRNTNGYYSFDLDPPVLLKAGMGYVVVDEDRS